MRTKACAALLLVSIAMVARGADDAIPEPTQKVDVPFRLFRSKNFYNYLKLDTRTGMIWQVEWGMEPGYEWIAPINLVPLADGKEVGRFTLVPTANLYTFLLLDQRNGRVWHVQWSTDKPKERFIVPIETPLIQTTEDKPPVTPSESH
jgi:hypothetical protein